tara:strand:+ start:820 stop:1032 length:213 start_codon:yes stop_codon:yes gene_type:complete
MSDEMDEMDAAVARASQPTQHQGRLQRDIQVKLLSLTRDGESLIVSLTLNGNLYTGALHPVRIGNAQEEE